MSEPFICDAVRTPIGRYGGALSAVRADDLAAVPIAALLRRNPSLEPGAIEEVLLGCANQAGEDNRNVARMAALLAGLPVSVPGATINRLCGSGLDAVLMAARAISHAEGGLRIQPQRRGFRYDNRVALRQSRAQAKIRCRFHAGNRRERRRRLQGVAG